MGSAWNIETKLSTLVGVLIEREEGGNEEAREKGGKEGRRENGGRDGKGRKESELLEKSKS